MIHDITSVEEYKNIDEGIKNAIKIGLKNHTFLTFSGLVDKDTVLKRLRNFMIESREKRTKMEKRVSLTKLFQFFLLFS